MNRNILYIIILSFFVTVSCASRPVGYSVSKKIPQERIFFEKTSSVESESKIRVTRDSGTPCSGHYAHFKVDGKLLAKFDVAEGVEFTVSAGKHIVGVYVTDVFNDMSPIELEINAIKNEVVYLRIGCAGYLTLQRSAEIN